MKTIHQTLPCLFMAIMICACNNKATHFQANTTLDLQTIADFYNYSTVDWQKIDTLYYRPYSCDWTEEIERQIVPQFPMDIAAQYWNRLQNAKTYFHQQTLPLRAISDKKVCHQIDITEQQFDTIFVRCISQEYYMRLFVDCYNEIMPQQIDCLFEKM